MKKIINILLVVVLFFSLIANVSAKKLTINEVANRLNETSDPESFEAVLSPDINAMIINASETVTNPDSPTVHITSYSYTEDYIEYVNDVTTLTEENYVNELLKVMEFTLIFGTVLELNDIDLSKLDLSNVDLLNSYDTLGIYYEADDQEITVNTTGNGINFDSKLGLGLIKKFKISLDSDKIANLKQYLKAEESTSEESEEEIDNPKTSVDEEVQEKTDNPETGAFINTVVISASIVVSIIVILLAIRTNKFYKI